MENCYRKRINLLREKMKEEGIDYWYMTDTDCHNSEYTGDSFKLRSLFCGFTGSNGILILSKENSLLWTDGRYFIQAQKELEGSGVQLMKMGQKGVIPPFDYLTRNATDSCVLGICGDCVTKGKMEELADKFHKDSKELTFYYRRNLAKEVLDEESENSLPKQTFGKIRVLPISLQGAPLQERVDLVRKELIQEKCYGFVSAKLDVNMWLLHLRGEDIPYNPVAYSFVYITMNEIVLFVNSDSIDDNLREFAQKEGILLQEYRRLEEYVIRSAAGERLMLRKEEFPYSVATEYERNGIRIIDSDAGCEKAKGIKTEIEQARIREAYQKDSVAMCKFLYQLSQRDVSNLDEYQVARMLDSIRLATKDCNDLSFETISAYGPNAAMMHYEAKEEGCSKLRKEGLLLVDSGGQYEGGTTDVTRTIALGEVSERMKQDYTCVIRGMLALQNANFLYGCTGINLDILARMPMWERGIDYKCGTGHGIGYMLNVHEGPHSIRYKGMPGHEATILEEGMIVSDEPGIYIENEYGIRMENILLCRKGEENTDGQFMKFEVLTLVPIDLRLVDISKMQPKEIEWLAAYQMEVYRKIEPFLSKEETKWLQSETNVKNLTFISK